MRNSCVWIYSCCFAKVFLSHSKSELHAEWEDNSILYRECLLCRILFWGSSFGRASHWKRGGLGFDSWLGENFRILVYAIQPSLPDFSGNNYGWKHTWFSLSHKQTKYKIFEFIWWQPTKIHRQEIFKGQVILLQTLIVTF